MSRVIEAHGRIDVLVNNAGLAKVAPAIDEPLDDFRQVIDLDLIATFDMARLAARAMSGPGGGSIVNVASIVGLVGTGTIPMAAYSAARGGVIALTRELAAQWGRQGIRVNSLSPGWIAAGMGSWTVDDEDGRRWIERRTPLRRVGQPHELDGTLLFFASDASTHMSPDKTWRSMADGPSLESVSSTRTSCS